MMFDIKYSFSLYDSGLARTRKTSVTSFFGRLENKIIEDKHGFFVSFFFIFLIFFNFSWLVLPNG